MKKWISVLLVAIMLLSLFAGCSKKEASGPETTTPSTDNSPSASNETVSDADAAYTYHGTYSGVSTWSPTDWQISSEYDMLGYTVTELYGFWMNETKDGYDIVCELAAEFPVDVTANYAGNATYGVPADATEGYAWQIKLREDAVWEDGTPITAHDFEYTLQQFLNPEMKNYRASLFYMGGTALANDFVSCNTPEFTRYCSNGFFLSAVLFLGCGTLTFIAEAGNFYGLQYLGYTLVRVFSPRKERFDDRKDYFTYCTEKKAKQTEKGRSAAKWVMLFVGFGCLVLSVIFAFVFYNLT